MHFGFEIVTVAGRYCSILTFPVFLAIVLSGTLAPENVCAKEQIVKPEMRFESIPHRMTSNHVSNIHEDSRGFLWMGGSSGLNRYDGVGFRMYESGSDPHSLADNIVGDIYEDSSGELWVAGRDLMSKYCYKTDRFARYQLPANDEGSASRRLRRITEDSSGTLWVSGGSHGLYYFDAEQDTFMQYQPLKTHDINTVFITEDNIIWATTEDHGLQKIDPSTGDITSWKHDPDDPHSLSSNNLNHVVKDSQGTFWVGSRNRGVNRMITHDDGSLSFKGYYNQPGKPDVLFNNYVYNMYVGRDGTLWLANDNGGIHRYDPEHDMFHHYTSDPDDPFSLSHESVSSVYQDSSGRIWVGTAMAGVNVHDPFAFKFRNYHTASQFTNRLSSNVIRDFQESIDGNLWVATDGGGLNFMDLQNEAFHSYRHDPGSGQSIQSDAVLGLERDHKDRLWVSTYNGGLDVLEDKEEETFSTFEDKYGLDEKVINNSFGVHFDEEHPYIWIAEFRVGVIRYHLETGELDVFQPDSDNSGSLSSAHILYIFEDSSNNIWFGSLRGLSKIASEDKKEGVFRTFLPDDENSQSIPGANVWQIAEDHEGSIWAATEKGLVKYLPDSDSFLVYNKEDGFPSNEIRSVTVDNNGDLWVGSIEGLTHFQPETGAVVNYSEKDGLQGYEFSRYAAEKLSDGQLAFGGANGMNLFYPDSIKTNPYIPPVYITDFKIFNEPVGVDRPDSPLDRHVMTTDTITLSHRDNVMTFEFIALNYTRPEQNSYAYMLEGFDSDWNYIGNQRSATYTNLDPGSYTFRVKASNNDNIWNEDGAYVELVIVPPFWQTAWFYSASVVTMIIVVIAGFRIKVNRIRKRNTELERQVSERTSELQKSNELLNAEIAEKNKVYSILAHDLRNPFMSIIGYAEYLHEKFEKDKDKENRQISTVILKAAENVYRLLENLFEWASSRDQTTRIVKEPFDVTQVIDECIETARLSADLKKIRLKKSVQPGLNALADRNMIQTVLRNLVTNAIKFSNKESVVTVEAADEGDEIIFKVIDNGIGMSGEEKGKIFSAASGYRKNGTNGEKGSGFGLMVCKDFIEQNGGSISVQSQKGEGSTFIFTLSKADSGTRKAGRKNIESAG